MSFRGRFRSQFGRASVGGSSGGGVSVPPTDPPNFPPTVSLDSPAPGAIFTSVPLTVTGSASDPDGTITQVRLYANDVLIATDTSAPYSFSWSPSNGTYDIKLVARNNDGIEAVSAIHTIQVAVPVNQVPTVTITDPTPGQTITVIPHTINVTATDPDGSVQYVLAYSEALQIGAADPLEPYQFPWSPANGTHTLTAAALDDDGEWGYSSNVVVTVAVPPPPAPNIGSVTVGSTSLVTGQLTTLSWANTGSAATLTTVDRDGNGSADYTLTNQLSQAISYPAAGTFTPTVTATNSSGSDSDVGPAIVVSLPPPFTTTFTLTNDGAFTTGTDWVSKPYAHQFKPGDIPNGQYPRFRIGGAGADIPYSYWNRANHADGSWRNAGFMFRIPTAIASLGTMTIEVSASSTPPGSTSRTLANIQTRDFKLRGTGKVGISALDWVSSVNQGIIDADDIYEFTDSGSGRGGGNVCRYWRIGQGFRNGSTEDEQIYARYYIFVIENSSGGLYGFRITPEWSNPFGNGFVTVTKPRWVVMERDFGFYDGASPVCMAPLKDPYTFTRKTPTPGVTYDRVEIDYTGETTNFAIGDTITGASSGATAIVWWMKDNGSTGTLVTSVPSGSGFTLGETITSGAKSAVIASSARPCVGFQPSIVPDSYKLDYITVSSTGTLPAGLATNTLYGCTHAANNFYLSPYGCWASHNNPELRVATTDAGTGVHTATPYPGIPRATKLYVLPTSGEELFVTGGGTGADVEVRIKHNKAYQRSTGVIPPYPDTAAGTAEQSVKPYQFGQMDSLLHEFDERQTGANRQIGYMHEEYVRDFFLQTKNTRRNTLVLACQFGVRRNFLVDRTSKKQNYIIPNAYAGLGLDFTNYDFGIGQVDATFGATGWKWSYGYAVVTPSHDEFHYTGDTFTNQHTDHHNNPPLYAALVSGRAEFLDMHIDDVCFNALWTTTTINGAQQRNFTLNSENIKGFMMWQAFQARDSAWALRGLLSAMILLPQSDPYYTYFSDLYHTFFETNFKFKAVVPAGLLATGNPYFYYNGTYQPVPTSTQYLGVYTVFSHLYIHGIIAWAHKAVPHARSQDAVDQLAKYLAYWKSISLGHMWSSVSVFWWNNWWIYKDGMYGKVPPADAPFGAVWRFPSTSWDATANTITIPFMNVHASGDTGRAVKGLTNGDRIMLMVAFNISSALPAGMAIGVTYYCKNVVQNNTNSFTCQLSTLPDLSDTVDITNTSSGTLYATGVFALGLDRPSMTDATVVSNAMQIMDMLIGVGATIPSDVITEMDNWKAALPTLYSGRLRFSSQRTW